MSSYKVGVIGGDGIGPDVLAEALKVVDAAGVTLDTTEYELGAKRYIRTGEVLPDSVLEEIRGQDAILLGAIGAAIGSTEVPPGTLERGLLLKLRFALDLYINLRPFTGVPGAPSPDCDFIVIRENTEGTYAGEGGLLRKGTPFEVATQGSVNTRHGVERCARYAFALAETRERKHLTLVHKTNVLTFAGDLWQRTVDEVAPDYPGVSRDYNHVDATCIYLVENPARYDVIVTDNLFGDIITDLAGILQGGMGVAAGGNINPDPGGLSMFEPMGGSAPKYTGQNVINPIAAINAASMLLDQSGYPQAGERVMKAVQTVTGTKMKSQAAGKIGYGTKEIGDLVCEAL